MSATNTPSPVQGLVNRMRDVAMEALSPGSTPGSRAATQAFLASHRNCEDYDITEVWPKRVYGTCVAGQAVRAIRVICLIWAALDWDCGVVVYGRIGLI